MISMNVFALPSICSILSFAAIPMFQSSPNIFANSSTNAGSLVSIALMFLLIPYVYLQS